MAGLSVTRTHTSKVWFIILARTFPWSKSFSPSRIEKKRHWFNSTVILWVKLLWPVELFCILFKCGSNICPSGNWIDLLTWLYLTLDCLLNKSFWWILLLLVLKNVQRTTTFQYLSDKYTSYVFKQFQRCLLFFFSPTSQLRVMKGKQQRFLVFFDSNDLVLDGNIHRFVSH